MEKDQNKVEQLIKESGLITHFKTINLLRESGWKVLVAPYYYDPLSESIREVDLIAEKQFNSHGYGPSIQINVQLFIECKYIKPDVVFWFDEVDRRKAIASFEKEIGRDLVDAVAGYRLSGDLTCDQLHYFQENSVAKLFRDNHPNKKDQIFSAAMNQCLHSLINYRKTGKKPIFFHFKDTTPTTKIVQYPIIVCDNFNNLSSVNFNKDLQFTTDKISDHFIIETNYRDDYFLIDVVDINYTTKFLDKILTEATAIMKAHD